MAPFKKWVIANDTHFPIEDRAAVDCLIQTIDFVKPDGMIFNGDIMDCGVFSRHDIEKAPKKHWNDSEFYRRSVRDYTRMGKFLDIVGKISPHSKKIWNLGNHELWLEQFIAGSPKVRKPLFGLQERLNLKERGILLQPYKKPYSLGRLDVVHTVFDSSNGGGGKYHAIKSVDTWGDHVLYGHNHNIQIASKVTRGKDSRMGYGIGCLCTLNPQYLKNSPQNWSHGFAIVYLKSDGSFQVDVKRIFNGWVVVEGHMIDGKKARFWN